MNNAYTLERYMKKISKKDKDIEDQKILDKILRELKKKHDEERKVRNQKIQKEIDRLKKELTL